MFHKKGKTEGTKGPMPIGEAVEWSRTARGGKQLMLIEEPREGCMRWGLCDSAPEDAP